MGGGGGRNAGGGGGGGWGEEMREIVYENPYLQCTCLSVSLSAHREGDASLAVTDPLC